MRRGEAFDGEGANAGRHMASMLGHTHSIAIEGSDVILGIMIQMPSASLKGVKPGAAVSMGSTAGLIR
jgi:hypothetical protein